MRDRVAVRLRAGASSSPPPPGFEAVARELPAARVTPLRSADRDPTCALEAATWRAQTLDAWTFDRAVERRAASAGVVVDLVADAEHELAPAALEVLTRCQRVLGRRNAASRCALFDRVLAGHRALYEDGRALVVADRAHTLDVWQWTLRLDPDASLAAQAAALLHDVDRLAGEADARVEHRADDYAAWKRAHAARGAELATRLLRAAGAPVALVERVAALVAAHEDPADDPETRVLADADGLGFFSLNAPGYVDYFGEAQARRKIDHTLARLGAAARARLPALRLRPDVARLLAGRLAP